MTLNILGKQKNIKFVLIFYFFFLKMLIYGTVHHY
jgi:hypothetical protein